MDLLKLQTKILFNNKGLENMTNAITELFYDKSYDSAIS
jgi:hypothetical protein